MKLRLLRENTRDETTLGNLYMDGIWFCHTLEDRDRRLESGGVKVKGQTAIPLGTYPVIIDFSNRFQKLMMHVLNVPQFAGIRIHAGNTIANTEGCILLGEDVDRETLIHSRVAVNRLQNEVAQALDRAEAVNLTVERE